MKIRLLLSAIFTLSLTLGHGQARPAPPKQDTVVVALTPSSKVTFTIGDHADLETLKHYNFQALFQDIISKLEHRDTSALPGLTEKETTVEANPTTQSEDWNVTASPSNESYSSDNNNNENWNEHVHHSGFGRTWQSFNIDFGTNNYLS